MSRDGVWIGRHVSRFPFPASRRFRSKLRHPRAIRCVQEDPVGADELQGVPLYWVVTGRNRDPAAGRMVLDRQLHRGCRNQADFHDGAPHGTQAVDHRPLERRPRLPGIPSDDHDRLPPLRPAAEGSGVAPDDLVGQVLPHDASDARDTDHQRVGHVDNLVRWG